MILELNSVRDFVKDKMTTDKRIIVIKPKLPIIQMLRQEGYPYKSKAHARLLADYQRHGLEHYKSVRAYLELELTASGRRAYRVCPKKLKHQFTEDYKLKVSDKCCYRLKEEPMRLWQKENNKAISITGVMRQEGGRRKFAQCALMVDGKLKAFQPLAPLSKE